MRAAIILLLVICLVACGTPPQTVTMDGYDAASGTTVNPINIWASYEPRGARVGQVQHGERVTLLQRSGSGAQIQTAQGVRGWVGVAFIKELKR